MAVELNQNPYIFLLCCFIFALMAFNLTRTKSKTNLPPSPPKLPIIGNLHQIGKLSHRSFRDLSHKYGPLMLLHLCQTPTLVVSSADIAREMAKTNDVVFSDRPSITAAKIHFYECNDVIFAPYGEGWRQKRKISIAEFLGSKKVRSFHFISEEEVANLVTKIREACMKNDGSSVSVNLIQMLIVTSTNIMCRCVFGRKYETPDGSSGRFEEIVMAMMHQIGEFSFGNFFPSLWWMDIVTGLLPRMKRAGRLHNTRERKGILMRTRTLWIFYFNFNTINMFAAGIDTTSTTVEWAMAELMRHPGKMTKAQKEVREIVGHKSRISEPDVNQMSYLKFVVKETLRLHPPSPLLAPRKTNSSVKLGGYDIPPKTNVLVNGWAIHRDPNYWERPEEFVPERFKNSEVDFKGQDFQFIPFGFGRRGCPGLPFGVASIEYTMANLLYWFDWKLPSRPAASVKEIDMREANGQVVSKKIPLLLQPMPHSLCLET